MTTYLTRKGTVESLSSGEGFIQVGIRLEDTTLFYYRVNSGSGAAIPTMGEAVVMQVDSGS